ncbi:MAG: hypothetical protein AB4038_03160 [Prochloraceae cyanobacterium]
MKIFGICSILFFVFCGHHIVKTYETNPKEAVFEGFLLATIASYHVVLFRNLQQLPEQEDDQKLMPIED